jgi:cytochrome c5
MKKIIILISVTFFVACAAYKPLAPSQTDAERATQKFPGTTLADLNQGKTIFEESCKKCHSLKKPFTKSEEEIRNVLPKMAKKAKIDSQQEDLVLKYLLTMNTAQAPK